MDFAWDPVWTQAIWNLLVAIDDTDENDRLAGKDPVRIRLSDPTAYPNTEEGLA